MLFLVGGKSYSCYTHAFTKLSELIDNFMPNNIVIDFEIAAFKAVKDIFPDSRIYLCNFNLSQSVYRQLQKRELAKLYGGNSEFRIYIQMLLP
jgi:hypothetical protein